MSKNIEYMIAHSPTVTGLENTIPAYVREGWQLQDGVSAVPRQPSEEESAPGFGPVYSYMQAMVRPIPEEVLFA
jgi:hypothetical protein